MTQTNAVGNPWVKPKIIVYIDGYNWYHAVFKHHPEWKWLTLESFFRALRPREEVIAVKLFSAMVDAHNPSSDAYQRQSRWFDALRTLPSVKIVLGLFQNREVSCRIDCGKPIPEKKYTVPEEKKTDVNIAVEMMADALTGCCERLCVVSGDSDVQPVVEWIATHRKNLKLTVYVPAIPQEQSKRRLDYYRTRGVEVESDFLPLENLSHHQLKSVVQLGNGKVAVRPPLWKKVE
jgi:uncharacterized LabA/DUF88 family protein